MTISTKLRGVSPFTFKPGPCDPRIWNHISHGIVALVFAGKVVDTFPAKSTPEKYANQVIKEL